MTNTTEPKTGHAIPYFAEMLRYQAWIGMGKIANPQTQDIDRNMEAARMAIDLLSELETKTEGNHSEAETKLLQGVLTDLRLNYLDEEKKGAAEPEAAVESETIAEKTESETVEASSEITEEPSNE
jgi:hypothetical protein